MIVFMKNFKVYEVTEIMYDQQSDDVKYNVLFKYDVEKCENNKLKGAFNAVKKHYKTINIICGIFLIVVGVLMASGLLDKLLRGIA